MIIWLTGCTSGLGRALVPEFVKAGHTVVGCGRNEIALQHLRDEFPKCFFLAADVSSDESAGEFCDEALFTAGAPDLLINNAAIINEPMPLWEISAEDFDELTSVNINGVANIATDMLRKCMGEDAEIHQTAEAWATTAAPFLTGLTPENNGQSLTAP